MYERILVPVDGSESSTRALDEALAIARLVGGGPASQGPAAVADSVPALRAPRLKLLYVLDDVLDQADLKAEGDAALAAALERAERSGVVAEAAVRPVRGSSIAGVILAEADAGAIDLIVLGTHGRTGLRRAILGSVAEEVVRNSRLPVLLPGRVGGGG